MSYEAGSKECKNLIEAKESLLSAMESLSGISSSEKLQMQIKDIYKTLETMHEQRREIESATNVWIIQFKWFYLPILVTIIKLVLNLLSISIW